MSMWRKGSEGFFFDLCRLMDLPLRRSGSRHTTRTNGSNFISPAWTISSTLNRSGYAFTEFYAATILAKMLTPFEPGFVDLRSPAGIGIAAIVYNYDGDVYASDESRMLAEMGDKTFRIGNVHRDRYEDIILSDALLGPIEESFAASVPMCSDCAFEPFCGADPVFHHATQGDFVGRKPLSAFCGRNMSIFRRLITLMRNDDEVRRIFVRWANSRC